MTVAEEITFPISPLQEIMYTMALCYLTKGMSMDNYRQFCPLTVLLIAQVGFIGVNNEFGKRIKMSSGKY